MKKKHEITKVMSAAKSRCASLPYFSLLLANHPSRLSVVQAISASTTKRVRLWLPEIASPKIIKVITTLNNVRMSAIIQNNYNLDFMNIIFFEIKSNKFFPVWEKTFTTIPVSIFISKPVFTVDYTSSINLSFLIP